MATLNHPRKAVARDGLLLSLGRVALEETKVRANANRHWAGDRRRAVPEPERPADTGRPLSIRAADRRKAIGGGTGRLPVSVSRCVTVTI
jgi:hypothetical protein